MSSSPFGICSGRMITETVITWVDPDNIRQCRLFVIVGHVSTKDMRWQTTLTADGKGQSLTDGRCLLVLFISNCQLEGHSVERMYLRQWCSDGSVNKTIWKPRFAAAASRQYVCVGFSCVKFHLAVLIQYRRKQSGSGIRTITRIRLKS